MEDAGESSGKGWWTEFRHDTTRSALDLAEAEAHATALDNYESLLIPGLLQTRAYSEVIQGFNEKKVEFRHERHKILTGNNAPPYRAVIHEAALHMMYGGPTVIRDQLNHLIEMSRLPNVTIQILPFDCTTYASNDTPFLLIRGAHTRLDTVLLEHPHGSDFIGDSEVVTTFDRKFDRLRGLALPSPVGSDVRVIASPTRFAGCAPAHPLQGPRKIAMHQLNWQKSSFSSDQANCVEIASADELVYIRESDDPAVILTTTPAKLNAWIASAKAGEFDHFIA
ncbi:DUF397 domain-containing protein [Streptomyces sp. NRRL WC-3742]|uniref:DUF397 domain-containing protein n=1 Tax=Streptomyces sp. NRRL WC-3742 TaxID=1463934 RepID=UPI001F45C425|nr:DUF397 domain-containing protein [Streptomyces sp. NRRL WC-3742]